MFRLPDLPTAGYATQRERELTDMVMDFMRQVERDRIRLLTIVIEGKARWRSVAGSIWGAHRVGEEHGLLDGIFDYFTIQACRPRTQQMLLNAKNNPPKWAVIVKAAMPHLERERERLRLVQTWSPFQ